MSKLIFCSSLGSISLDYNRLTAGDVCKLQKSNWLGRIFIKLKFFFLQHKGWVTTEKINQLVQDLGKCKQFAKLQVLDICLSDVKVELKSVNSKINNLVNLVERVCTNTPLDDSEIIAIRVENCDQLREYVGKIIQLKVGRYASKRFGEDETSDYIRGQQGNLNPVPIKGKLISVSDEPVYDDSGRYRVTVGTVKK